MGLLKGTKRSVGMWIENKNRERNLMVQLQGIPRSHRTFSQCQQHETSGPSEIGLVWRFLYIFPTETGEKYQFIPM